MFVELGYRVELTKASGDQGVDLIVTRNGQRIAIQAKGYSESNRVTNSAVQQAYTGMVFYRCDKCAVITNSSFTRHAEKLAVGTNCVLVDRRKIPDLVHGRVTL